MLYVTCMYMYMYMFKKHMYCCYSLELCIGKILTIPLIVVIPPEYFTRPP